MPESVLRSRSAGRRRGGTLRDSIRSHVLVAVHVLFLVSIFWLLSMARYEDRLFDWFVTKTVTASMSQEEKALALMHRTHEFVGSTAGVFADRPRVWFSRGFLNSADVMLLEGYGWCGAFTHVLARSLREAGFETRIAQMNVGGIWGGHILVETRVDGAWVAMDPTFDHVFRRPGGGFASIDDLIRHWDAFRDQVPPGYDTDFDYDGVRYANWNKIPVAGPAVRAVLSRFLGEARVNGFSPRVYILNTYAVVAWALVVVYATLVLAPNLVAWRRRRAPADGAFAPARGLESSIG